MVNMKMALIWNYFTVW